MKSCTEENKTTAESRTKGPQEDILIHPTGLTDSSETGNLLKVYF